MHEQRSSHASRQSRTSVVFFWSFAPKFLIVSVSHDELLFFSTCCCSFALPVGLVVAVDLVAVVAFDNKLLPQPGKMDA